MSDRTRETAARETAMAQNWVKRTPVRIKEQEEKHKANQKINRAGERRHLIAAGEIKRWKRKIAKRRAR